MELIIFGVSENFLEVKYSIWFSLLLEELILVKYEVFFEHNLLFFDSVCVWKIPNLIENKTIVLRKICSLLFTDIWSYWRKILNLLFTDVWWYWGKFQIYNLLMYDCIEKIWNLLLIDVWLYWEKFEIYCLSI